MNRIYLPFVFFALAFLSTVACKHEPFPAPPSPVVVPPVDTTENPVSGKPCHPDTVYFSRDVLPVLASNCAYAGCHGAGSAQKGVILDSYAEVMATADVRAFDPSGSDLYEVISESDPDKRMPPPPNQPLSKPQVDLIRKWISQGALNLDCQSCDSTELRYSGEISKIVQQNCLSCHSGASPSAGLDLSNYANLQDAILNTNLIQRINGVAGVPPMPPGALMSDCDQRRIEQWRDAGFPQ